MTGRAIDHIVLAVHDLDAAAETFEALGFTLTPRAAHEDRMGTSNRLAQFAERNFIELLEADRPGAMMAHDPAARPPVYSFGAQNRDALKAGEGASFLVFRGDDAEADSAAFAAAGAETYAPFRFERQAKAPDGESVTVAFSLAFATSPDMPRAPLFTCRNEAPGHFWKPDYQRHANGAAGIRRVYFVSDAPARDAGFIAGLFGGEIRKVEGGAAVACGEAGEVRVLTPEAIAERDAGFSSADFDGPRIIGAAIARPGGGAPVSSTAAHGLFIEWIEG